MERIAIHETNIGPDKVQVGTDTIVIYATRIMADWTIREFCRVPIYFQSRKYFLRRKEPAPAPYAIRYELASWTADLPNETTRFINYDETYVAEREHEFKSTHRNEHLHSALMCLYPLLGFFWSEFKERVLGPIGFEPRSITSASIMLAFSFFLLEGIFVFYFRSGFAAAVFGNSLFYLPLVWLDRFLLCTLPVDCLFRYGQLLGGGDDTPGGILEWLFKTNTRK
ncbi:MAG: hypothetical protein JWQ71_1543 [Pedosphaera sp.]|nr:hypothetical protein [Pedosphaera sp.]